MTGALWTGIDLFMGIALGPAARAAIFMKVTPRLTFFMPVVVAVASTVGISWA